MTADTAHHSATDRSTWASILRERFVALDVAGAPDDACDGLVDSWSMGRLMLAQVRSRPQVITRTTSLVRQDSRAYLQVGRLRSGRAVVEQDGRTATLAPGDFVVYETTRPFTWSLRPDEASPTWHLDVLTWPRESIRLSEDASHEATAVAMSGRSGLSAVVSTMLGELMDVHPDADQPGSTAFADEIGDLLGVLAASLVPPQATHPDVVLMRRIDAYIDDHLADPDLNPESLARAHAVSVRQLHRLFAARQHTVTRTIRGRRLEMCRRDLAAPGRAGCSVTEIALRWGFTDLGAFGRAFRETFGVSPGRYRLDALDPGSNPWSPGPS